MPDLNHNAFNTKTIGFPVHLTIIDVFLEQVEKTPANTAVSYNEKVLTYEELNDRSNQFAHYLISLGVQSETLVAVCMDKSLEMIIVTLGILKAGCAYVPLDPENPADRIRYILENSRSPFLVSTGNIGHLFADKIQAIPIYFDELVSKLSSFPRSLPGLKISPNNLAYVIYTSGSTGNPKGVMVEHRNVVRLFLNDAPLFRFSENDVWSMFHSYNFDFSVWEMYGALFFGGMLLIIPKEVTKDSASLHQLLLEKKVTVFSQTPSSFFAIQEDFLGREKLIHLRFVVFGGEALYPALLKEWRDTYPGCKLINMYGITETTVHVTYKEITEKEINSNVSDIGVPIPTLECLILDEDLSLVQIGEVGELCVGGAGLARGYLYNPELTSEKYIQHPFDKGERLYRSGDLAKQLPDGNFEFVGRRDNQVKIRGYRIELGEVENKLLEISGIANAVVVAKESEKKGRYLVAYIVWAKNIAPLEYHHLQEKLKKLLPAYMIPGVIVELSQMPLTSNGKIDKKALPEPQTYTRRAVYVAPDSVTANNLSSLLSDLLGIDRVGLDDNFFEMGGNSLLAQTFVARAKNLYSIEIPIIKLYQYPTIGELQSFLLQSTGEKNELWRPRNSAKGDVAIIGLECNFPGAPDITAFEYLLKNAKEAITFFPDDELDASIPAHLKQSTDYVKARGNINNAEDFDAEFFGIPPRLAEIMDPQHRLFLEVSRNLLEKTGYLNGGQQNRIGVFAGCSPNTYYNNNVVFHKDKLELQAGFSAISVTDKDFIASRVSYHLDLEGPAVNVNSACSTSLLAVAQAVQNIRIGQCNMAIAGGASLTVPIKSGHLYEEGAMASVDGHTRPFDANAAGTVFGDGAGAVLLKSLEDAEKDGDTIYAVIKGIGINNDGGNKGSFSAPSATGQATAIKMALEDSKTDPAKVSYVEAHGTATPLGDPIEIEGLKMAFGEQVNKQYCRIGSVKSNFGHLTHAAGVAGLIKTALSIYTKQIFPTINFSSPNPIIDFKNSPFVVSNELEPWENEKRIAGVSSFGVGGTNVHVILEGYESGKDEAEKINKIDDLPQLVYWSAHTVKSVNDYVDKLLSFLTENRNLLLEDIVFSLGTRPDLLQRNFVVARNTEELISILQQKEKLSASVKEVTQKGRPVVFMFPGQGSQYLNMGKELYNCEPVYKNAFDECAEILKPLLSKDIREVIFHQGITDAETASERLKDTFYTQPAIFVTSYALAKLYMSRNVKPSAFIGHSVGEFVAAHLSGVMTLQDALAIVAKRGKLISDLPGGAMLSVRADFEKLEKHLTSGISVAAINSAKLCVVSGHFKEIENFSKILDELEIPNKLLQTSHAFHSEMMSPVIGPLKEAIEKVVLNVPRIPVLSTVTAGWLKDEEALSSEYWANHTRATVNFAGAVKAIDAQLSPVFLEVGPGNVTATLARQLSAKTSERVISSISRDEEAELVSVMQAIGKLWQNGVDVGLNTSFKKKNHTLLHSLPTYAYDKKRYWLTPPMPDNVVSNLAVNIETPERLPAAGPVDTFTKSNNRMERKQILIEKIKSLIEATSGIDVSECNPSDNFMEIGMDSLMLTQISTGLRKEFNQPITFRQLNEGYDSVEKLAAHLDSILPAETYQPVSQIQPIASSQSNLPFQSLGSHSSNIMNNTNNTNALALIAQQISLLAQQVMALQGGAVRSQPINPEPKASPLAENGVTPQEQSELKKPFGAIAKIDKGITGINATQQAYLDELIKRYNQQTQKSKDYTQKYRAIMADPRVVSGFKPLTKEMVYSLVVKKSKGCRLWDIDDNEYVDVLNGFGSNFLGYQPDFLKEALIEQIEKGYEIGPQHELAGEVCELICEMTGSERAGLCNTGSESVLGAMRIARTVTGKDLIVAFTGSYHGIVDEALVRGTKSLKTFPAAPGILAGNVQNMLILDYGEEDSLRIISERANDIAGVLVEPVQSRRPELQPVEFLEKLREITEKNEIALIFDEVITGFRSHPGGTQALWGIKADVSTYGKVVGGGISIGVIAGKKKYLDALDGGFWQYGDSSVPEAGVTYFAGTFVRHPLALATSLATLKYLKEQGPKLQEAMNNKTAILAGRLNDICVRYRIPAFIAHFSSLWKIKFKEEYPYHELLFTLMRLKKVHIWDGFPCFLTTEHTAEDIEKIITVFEESVKELTNAGFIPQTEELKGTPAVKIMDSSSPPVAGARLGRDRNGNPAWFLADDANPGKYFQLEL